jgi:hypothetical protein
VRPLVGAAAGRSTREGAARQCGRAPCTGPVLPMPSAPPMMVISREVASSGYSSSSMAALVSAPVQMSLGEELGAGRRGVGERARAVGLGGQGRAWRIGGQGWGCYGGARSPLELPTHRTGPASGCCRRNAAMCSATTTGALPGNGDTQLWGSTGPPHGLRRGQGGRQGGAGEHARLRDRCACCLPPHTAANQGLPHI